MRNHDIAGIGSCSVLNVHCVPNFKAAVWKRVNISLLSLENAARMAGLWLAYGNLNLGRVPTPPRITVPRLWFVLYTCFPSRVDFGGMCRARLSMWLAPNRNPSLYWASLADNTAHILSQPVAGGSLARSVWICWERTLGCLFLQASPGHFFSLLLFRFTPSLLLILAMSTICSSSKNLPAESLNLVWTKGPLSHRLNSHYIVEFYSNSTLIADNSQIQDLN